MPPQMQTSSASGSAIQSMWPESAQPIDARMQRICTSTNRSATTPPEHSSGGTLCRKTTARSRSLARDGVRIANGNVEMMASKDSKSEMRYPRLRSTA